MAKLLEVSARLEQELADRVLHEMREALIGELILIMAFPNAASNIPAYTTRANLAYRAANITDAALGRLVLEAETDVLWNATRVCIMVEFRNGMKLDATCMIHNQLGRNTSWESAVIEALVDSARGLARAAAMKVFLVYSDYKDGPP